MVRQLDPPPVRRARLSLGGSMAGGVGIGADAMVISMPPMAHHREFVIQATLARIAPPMALVARHDVAL
jgi:hypothetical protein